MYPSTYLSIGLCQFTLPSIHPLIHRVINPSINSPFHQSIHQFTLPSIHPAIHPSINVSFHSPFHPSITSFTLPSIHPSVHPSITQATDDPVHPKLPVWRKLTYASGSMLFSMTTVVLGFFLQIFLLEVAIVSFTHNYCVFVCLFVFVLFFKLRSDIRSRWYRFVHTLVRVYTCKRSVKE